MTSKFDFHVVATLALRVWTLLAGAVTVVCVPFWLTAVEQGYYFTFASILAIQVFFELGFNYVIVQFTAAEMHRLRWSEGGRGGLLRGPREGLVRLGSLVRLARRAYVVLAVLYLVGVGASGFVFFQSTREQAAPHWLASWLLLVTFAAANLVLSPWMAVTEGTGRVGEIARIRAVQSVVGYGGMWIALACGAGLLAVPLISGCAVLGTGWWFWREGRFLTALARQAGRAKSHGGMSWKREIFPFQWRIALSWVSGYLIFQLFNPLLFHAYGAQEAGRVGLVLAIFGSLVTLSLSWINAKAPVLTQRIAAGDRAGAKALFLRQFKSSTLALLGCTAAFFLFLFLVVPHVPKLASRLPATFVIACIAIASIANLLVFALATFMRAHGEEPMVWPSIVVGLTTVAAMLLVGAHSVAWIMGSYAAIQVVLGLPWVCALFFSRYWNRPGHVPG